MFSAKGWRQRNAAQIICPCLLSVVSLLENFFQLNMFLIFWFSTLLVEPDKCAIISVGVLVDGEGRTDPHHLMVGSDEPTHMPEHISLSACLIARGTTQRHCTNRLIAKIVFFPSRTLEAVFPDITFWFHSFFPLSPHRRCLLKDIGRKGIKCLNCLFRLQYSQN